MDLLLPISQVRGVSLLHTLHLLVRGTGQDSRRHQPHREVSHRCPAQAQIQLTEPKACVQPLSPGAVMALAHPPPSWTSPWTPPAPSGHTAPSVPLAASYASLRAPPPGSLCLCLLVSLPWLGWALPAALPWAPAVLQAPLPDAPASCWPFPAPPAPSHPSQSRSDNRKACCVGFPASLPTVLPASSSLTLPKPEAFGRSCLSP